MSDNFESSLINLGELSKPATVLVEKISDAVGGIFKPYQLVRVAKAEAQAERVRVKGQIEISDLKRRAFHRFLEEEAKKQQNIEDITTKALPLLEETSKPDQVEDDWITNFFDRCRLISDDEMQDLWAKVLAGEANSPGKYSKRTVEFLSSLDKSDADLFTRLCGFAWDFGEVVPLVYDEGHEIYRKQGLTFASLIHLESIGLIQFGALTFSRVELPQKFSIFYYGNKVDFKLDGDSRRFPLGKALLTKTGQQLAPICGSTPVEGFYEYVLDHWENAGIVRERDALETADDPTKTDATVRSEGLR